MSIIRLAVACAASAMAFHGFGGDMAACKAAPSRSLTIMSYNIYECQGWKNPQGACNTNAISNVARIIRAVDPDVACLQEVDTAAPDKAAFDHTVQLSRLTGLHATFAGVFKHRNGGMWGEAILSREKPLSTREFHMDEVKRGPRRVALIAEFPRYVVCCTHLALEEEDRVKQSRLLLEELRKDTKPVFLCGDLNSTPDIEPMRVLGERFATLSATDGATWPSHHLTAKIAECIDYIMVDKAHAALFPVLKRSVIKDTEASDHCAVTVVLDGTRLGLGAAD